MCSVEPVAEFVGVAGVLGLEAVAGVGIVRRWLMRRLLSGSGPTPWDGCGPLLRGLASALASSDGGTA